MLYKYWMAVVFLQRLELVSSFSGVFFQVSEKNKLIMHDLLRDMGREIVRERIPQNTWESVVDYGCMRMHLIY
jgi:hypothetical protein